SRAPGGRGAKSAGGTQRPEAAGRPFGRRGRGGRRAAASVRTGGPRPSAGGRGPAVARPRCFRVAPLVSRAHVSAASRANIAAQARHRCGYCLTAESVVGMPMDVQHIIPEARGGETTEDNLWLACPLCNAKKGWGPVSHPSGDLVRGEVSRGENGLLVGKS